MSNYNIYSLRNITVYTECQNIILYTVYVMLRITPIQIREVSLYTVYVTLLIALILIREVSLYFPYCRVLISTCALFE